MLYCLLLLLPTLAAAAGALWLLHREQLRIDEQYLATAKGRKVALIDRAHLIAENVEILVIDIQNGLMNTLMEAPCDDPAAFLTNWKAANPLVGGVFQSANDGRIRWGDGGGAASSRLPAAPWNKPDIVAPSNPGTEPAPPGGTVSEKTGLLKESNAFRYQNQRNIAQKISLQNAAPAEIASAPMQKPKVSAKTLHKPGADLQKAKPRTDSSGWEPWFDNDGALRIFGWRLCPDGTALAVEINMAALEGQLGQMLPQVIPENESYSLIRADGSVLARVGNVGESSRAQKGDAPGGDSDQAANVPLSAQILPRWSVSGALAPEGASGANGHAFFLASAVLVAIFVCTILSGSALLLRQARISETESMQKTSFVANVSHELKTPLTSIRLHAELLEQNRVRDEGQRTRFLKAIGLEAQRLTRLVDNVLDFSRLEQGRRKPAISNVNVGRRLNEILDCHAARIEEAGLALARVIPESGVFLDTDSDALGQIVINLVDNACKYAASGGELEVALSQAEYGVKITVSDRGSGIPARHRKRIFEKFHRIDDSLAAGQGGAGLGLGIARQLAVALGGDLRHENRKNGGSRFTLTLRDIS